ncbi:hypothetical protein AQ490_23110 [Wenjunlia vitaminophila]|uniref:Uncharacterized protein n=1 Tax=Wenjunlia vitaminophila TaxID=76728 RepID=A0A0T6LSI4_WENVI|nr:hypothetical protein [Wenjunlia vitaminophila]KRV48764.1 hypothetical protein AQ490_23110 [Wenjunlia vitaminophila]
MPDPALLLDAVDRLSDTFRGLPQSRLLAGVPGFASRAEAGYALASSLADAGQRLEAPERPPARLPQAGPFAVGDQIAVTGHDLAAAIKETFAGGGDGVERAERALDAALREVEATARLIA